MRKPKVKLSLEQSIEEKADKAIKNIKMISSFFILKKIKKEKSIGKQRQI